MHTRYHISLDPGVRIFHMNHCVILRAEEGREGERRGVAQDCVTHAAWCIISPQTVQ